MEKGELEGGKHVYGCWPLLFKLENVFDRTISLAWFSINADVSRIKHDVQHDDDASDMGEDAPLLQSRFFSDNVSLSAFPDDHSLDVELYEDPE